MSNSSYIHVGHWINWSRGPITGATITLSKRDGGLLVAFLAVYVATAGSQFWSILSYIIHQVNASPHDGKRDGYHHQRQVILRNTNTAAGAAWEFAKLAYYWRGHAPITRCIGFILLAITTLAVFRVASIFTSEVSKAVGDTVLIRSQNCGFAEFPGRAEDGLDQWVYKLLKDSTAAADYARACYDQSENLLQCNFFPRRELEIRTSVNGSCPFTPSRCVKNTSTVTFESGLIDSHDSLGINAPQHDRISYQRVSRCRPVAIKDIMAVETLYNEVYNYDEDVLHVYAGETMGTREGRFNYTLAYNKHRSITMEGYDLKSFFAFAGYPNTLWKPISTLNRTDADVTLFFVLSNKVWYYSQSDDPIFSAHMPFGELYRSDYDVAALGCTDQHQICEPVDGTCTALTGSMLLMGEFRRIGLNEMQVSTAERILRELYYVNMNMAVSGRGSSALIASETVREDAQSASIPPDQWIIETRNWFSVGLSRLQQGIVSYASGPTNLGTYGVIDRPAANDSTGQSLCRNQMVRDTTGEHQSFSLLGVILIVVLGGAIILSNFFMDTVVGWVQNWTRWGVGKRRQWTYDGKFILLKVAFEGSTRDLRWIHEGDTEIPVTEGAHQLSSPLASLQTTVFKLKSHRQHSQQSNEESNNLLKKKEEACEMTEVV